MNVQVVYCNHQTTRLDVREKLAFATSVQLERAYQELHNSFPDSELVIISTCNRVEVYTSQEDSEEMPTRQQIAQFFADFHRVELNQFLDDLLEKRGPDAVRHLFEVASSLDSMVLGEPQIVNQIKEAYQTAQKNDACGPLTHALFQGAIRVSGRVRNETKLSEGRVSIASVAVGAFARSIFDRFDDKTVLIVGAGEMAEETLRYLKEEGVGRILVVNRNSQRAENLAKEWGGVHKSYDELNRWMAEADVIVSTTGAERPIVDVSRFAEIRKMSGEKPVFILDLGAPRDFEPAVGEFDDDVFLYDLDDLKATCVENRNARTKEIKKAQQIISEETDRFMHDVYHRATGPIIKRLREEWHEIRKQEMDLLRNKLFHLDETDLQAMERCIERVVNKLLHPPLEALRDEAKTGTPHGLLDALKRLFSLRD